ncbi:unnamed protein product [Paramecium pentaurelia]|uniref:Transmembrane protein n=1 Tax=Paramecium pentaurelia TaxID=43138 RepID=A0A8S1YDS9_9CILI|nr:unnamed protein product [Paramecium pentaurelia]
MLGILSFILIQIIKTSNCDSYSVKEIVILSLSSQEVVQIPYNELIQSSSSFILCKKDEKNDINVIDPIQQILQFNHNIANDPVKQLKQYKTSKNRIPRQSSIIIIQHENIQLVKIYWNKDPEFEIVYPYTQKILVNLEILDKFILINFQTESAKMKIYPDRIEKNFLTFACLLPELTVQIDDIIFSSNHNQLKSHKNWQEINLCSNTKITFQCKNKSIEIKNEITTLQVYPPQNLTFISENILVTLDLQQTMAECQIYPKILAYDYDLIKKIFVIISPDKIEYDGETYKCAIESKQIQVFLTKSFIIFRYGQEIQLFSKKLRLISTKNFDEDFQILANQLEDQFILVDKIHYQKYILHENPFIEINRKQNQQISFLQDIYDKQNNQYLQLVMTLDYFNNLDNLNISKTIEVALIQYDKQINNHQLINLKQCNYDEQIMGYQLFQQYNQLLKIYSYKVKVFGLDRYKIIFAFSSSYIYFGIIHDNNLQQFKQYTIQDEIINNYNTAFQIQDNKINYIHCTNVSCYIYYDIMKNYEQKKAKKFYQNKIQKVVSDNNHFYQLISKEVFIFQFVEGQEIQNQKLQIEEEVLDIFASPKKKDYLFVQTKTSRLYFYSISYPFQDLIQVFQLNYDEFLDFIIFENYFLILIKEKHQIICNVYNYKNEVNIFLQRQLPIKIFKEINFDELQVDYDQNTLYIKGQLSQSDEHAIIAYRIDTRIELSIQFISKLKSKISYLLPISDRMTLKFEDKLNFTSIFYNGDKETSCLIKKFQEDDIDEDDSFSETESEIESDDTLSLDENYQFSTSSFLSISSAEGLLILGIQSIYGRRRPENIDGFQTL